MTEKSTLLEKQTAAQERIDKLLTVPTEGSVGEFDYEDKFILIWKGLSIPEEYRNGENKYDLMFYFKKFEAGNKNDTDMMMTAKNPLNTVGFPLKGTVEILMLKRDAIKKMIEVNDFHRNLDNTDPKFGNRFPGLTAKYYQHGQA